MWSFILVEDIDFYIFDPTLNEGLTNLAGSEEGEADGVDTDSHFLSSCTPGLTQHALHLTVRHKQSVTFTHAL